MRLNGALRRSLALCLQISLASWIGSCSSSQQQQATEDLQNSNQEESAAVTQGDGQNAGEENVAYDENIGEQDDYNSGGDATVTDGTAGAADNTESELQDVIAQMNQDGSSGTSSDGILNPAVNQASTAAAPDASANQAVAPVAAAPGAAQTVGGLPEMNSKMPYIVQKGDTLGKIAKKIYGDQNRWSDIKELSALNNPNRIYPGDVVYYALTAESMAFAQAYELAPRNEIIVQQGQTLANIAAQVYGDSSTWKAIWRQNGHIGNPDRLEVGMVVYYLDQAALFSNLGDSNSAIIVSTTNQNLNKKLEAQNKLTQTLTSAHLATELLTML